MPRLFVGNFDFEHSLADSRYRPPVKLVRLNAELATSWLALAEDGDFIWSPVPLPPKFTDRAGAPGLPHVALLTDFHQAPEGVELVPWGWTDPLVQFARLHRWSYSAPSPQAVCSVNARQFSFDLEVEWECGLAGATSIHDAEQLDGALQRAFAISDRAVIKANWGMSARERILVGGELSDPQRAWARKRLAEQRVLFVEPWVRRLEEAGIQIHIPPSGTPQLIGVTSLICDEAGQYRGSWFTDPAEVGDDFYDRWRPATEMALRAAERLQDRGYFGPLGIDAMRYAAADGTVRLRPLQDINARWTMGRLSLGWRKLLRPGERGCWLVGSSARDAADSLAPAKPHRRLDLSLSEPNMQTMQHRSALLFWAES